MQEQTTDITLKILRLALRSRLRERGGLRKLKGMRLSFFSPTFARTRRRKLYLHAGVHRTGSTFVQQSLFENRDFLADRGLIYPFRSVHHTGLVNRIKFRPDGAAKAVEALKALNCGADDAIILSSEDFCSITSTTWLRLFARSFDVEIIFYVRRQDHWLSSWYNQNTKWPFNRDFHGLTPQDYLERHRRFFWLDYCRLLDRWSEVIGSDSIRVGVVGRHQLKNVVPDLLAKVGMADLALPTIPEAYTNESVSPYAAEMLRHVLPRMPTSHYLTAVQEAVRLSQAAYPKSGSMVFSPEQRRQLLEYYAGSNEKTARRYLPRSNGRLFLEGDVEAGEEYTRFLLAPDDPLIQELLTSALLRVARHIEPT